MFKKMIHKLGFNLYKSTYTLAVALLIAGSVFAQNPPPVQVYYVPFPEDQLLSALSAIAVKQSSSSQYFPQNPIQSYISIAVFADDTIIYYDQWENGFDADIANPKNIYSAANPGGTQIWGDGDPANGYPPGDPNDVLVAGNTT